MVKPPITVLLDKVENRYTLTMMAAKRARQIAGGAKRLTNANTNKEVVAAAYEIAEDKLKYVRTKSGLK